MTESTLENLRIRAGLKPIDVARTLATYTNNIRKWEVGIADPSLETIVVLKDIYKVTTDQLLDAWQESVKLGVASGARKKKAKKIIIWSVAGEEAKDAPLEESPSQILPLTLESLRIRAKLEPIDVARTLAIYPNSIRHWEQGTADPNLETFIILRNIYNVTSDELLDAWQASVSLGIESGARKKKPKKVINWSIAGIEEIEVDQEETEEQEQIPALSLEDLRLRVGLKLTDVARTLSTYPNNVRQWELGTSDPSLETFLILKDMYEVTLEKLAQAWQASVKLGVASGARTKKTKKVINWSVAGIEEIDRLKPESNTNGNGNGE